MTEIVHQPMFDFDRDIDQAVIFKRFMNPRQERFLLDQVFPAQEVETELETLRRKGWRTR